MKKSFIVFAFLISSQFCYSWDLKPGVYYMLESNVNIRTEPNLQGQIIGRLNLHDEIQILESAGNWQSIDNLFSQWYKIRYKNLTGYIFGGYIAEKSLIYDVDNNGIMDYFYYRRTYEQSDMFYADSLRDIIIYYNNRKIDTSRILNTTRDGLLKEYPHLLEWRRYSNCIGFEKINGGVRISLFDVPYEYHGDEPLVYEIAEYLLTSSGEIRYLGIRKADEDYIRKYF